MEPNYKDLYERQCERVTSLLEDLEISNAKLKGVEWVVGALRESKIARQRKALARLNRRVRVQRIQLRKLNELERGLRKDEWLALKDEYALELAEDDWDIEN